MGAVTRRLSGPDGDVSVTINPRLAVNDPGVLRDSVLAGVGLAWLPPLLVAEDVRQGRLIRLLPDWAPPTTEYHALFPSSRGLIPNLGDRNRSPKPSDAGRDASASLGFRRTGGAAAVAADHAAMSLAHRDVV